MFGVVKFCNDLPRCHCAKLLIWLEAVVRKEDYMGMVVHLRFDSFCVCLTDTNFLREKVKMTCGANADALCDMVKGSERFYPRWHCGLRDGCIAKSRIYIMAVPVS